MLGVGCNFTRSVTSGVKMTAISQQTRGKTRQDASRYMSRCAILVPPLLLVQGAGARVPYTFICEIPYAESYGNAKSERHFAFDGLQVTIIVLLRKRHVDAL